MRNMYTKYELSPSVNKKLKRQVERWGERYVRTDKQT